MKKITAILLSAIMIIPMCLLVACEDDENQGKGYEAIIVYDYGTLYFCNGVKTMGIRMKCPKDTDSLRDRSFKLIAVRKYNRSNKMEYNYHTMYDHTLDGSEWIFPGDREAEVVPQNPLYDGRAPSIAVDGCGYKFRSTIGYHKLSWKLKDKKHNTVDTFTLYIEIY